MTYDIDALEQLRRLTILCSGGRWDVPLVAGLTAKDRLMNFIISPEAVEVLAKTLCCRHDCENRDKQFAVCQAPTFDIDAAAILQALAARALGEEVR